MTGKEGQDDILKVVPDELRDRELDLYLANTKNEKIDLMFGQCFALLMAKRPVKSQEGKERSKMPALV
jgi:hypothetical protein